MSASMDAMSMLTIAAQREGWREGYRAGRAAALRSLGAEGARALLAAIEAERADWRRIAANLAASGEVAS